MQKKIIYFFILFILSCNKLPESAGLDNDVIIFSSLEDKKEIEFKINDMFGDFVNTPIEENKYNIKWITPGNFKNYQYYKNIIILSLAHPADSTIDILYKKFTDQYNDLQLFSLYDLYSDNLENFVIPKTVLSVTPSKQSPVLIFTISVFFS